MERLLVLAFSFAVLGCDSAGLVADAGSIPDGPHSCFEPLTASDWLCAACFADQVAGNSCNANSTTTQSICGQYRIWQQKSNPPIRPGIHACIYADDQNGALVGAKTCGMPDATCTNGCIEYGAILLSQVTSCGPATDLCSPQP